MTVSPCTAAGRLGELEAEVAELRRQLAEAQKLASIGRLTSGVAHDFNNFLTVILSNAALLRSQAKAAGDDRAARLAAMIERAGERGARLASQLLRFARKQTLFPETTRLGPLLAAMRELLRRAAGAANTLEIRCLDDVWPLRIDPTQLESALLNLVINAADAMPAAGGAIAITAENVTLGLAQAASLRLPPGDFVRIGVADSGTGIAPDLLERVFEPFFTTKAGKGSGLGLPQVRGFAGQSGGAVEVKSEPGRGTTVLLLLPRGPTTASAAAATAGSAASVLIVEDEEDLRATARTMLEEHGYRVLEAKDAEGARRLLGAEAVPIDVLFADLVLPDGVSGLELARQARALRPQVRVLLTAGYLPAEEADGSGEFQFLLKPYSMDKLTARMAGLIAGAAPPPLVWSAAHALGVQEIDQQHAKLGALLNALAAALQEGEDHTAVLREIVRFAEFHFAAEERLMAVHQCDGAAAHRDAHRRLLEEIRAFRPDADGASVGVALRYLQEWLLQHVNGPDRELAEALRARGVQ
jgi:hemerythrin-like metal-binding protein